MDFKDYYAALGVEKGASQDEIKRSYRKLARKHHPDVNPGDLAAERRFKEINEAQEVLGDPEKRRKYDELGANWRMYEQAGPGGASPFAGGSPFTGRRSTGGAGGFHTMSPEEAESIFGGASPFSDFFQTFFTGGAQGGSARGPVPRRGRDIEHSITLTLEEAYDGTRRRLSLSTGGRTRRVDVKIPPGVGDGSRVRVAGEGEPGTHDAPAGDLFLRVKLAPHAVFTRRGQELHLDVAVPVTTAVLGGSVPVPRLRGTPLSLKIPPSTQNGQVFRLKGHGMPALGKTRRPGDLYAAVTIRVPDELTASQRAHYEALAALDLAPADATAKGG
ncbi:MAG: J domain-containing protein [Vicinamibacterales bacterium]|jgi:DnaJ-class molecular chaperone|nr:J domain-containing protein [Vicinamibacterales bacterium]